MTVSGSNRHVAVQHRLSYLDVDAALLVAVSARPLRMLTKSNGIADDDAESTCRRSKALVRLMASLRSSDLRYTHEHERMRTHEDDARRFCTPSKSSML
jgi:hypothetical protein